MAADGGWPARTGLRDERERTLGGLRLVLGELEDRLSGGGDSLGPAATAALLQALDALAARIARLEADVAQQAARAAQIAEVQHETSAQLEEALTELADLRAGRLPEPAPIRAVLMAAAGAAALAVTGAGVLALSRADVLPAFTAPLDHIAHLIQAPAPKAAAPRPRLAPGPPAVAPTPADAVDTYGAVVGALARGEAMAVARLTGLAKAGDPQAQLHLANFYETGEGGLPQDLAAARFWTERAASGGERLAMHNLGLFLMEGEGGPRDVGQAAVWFRRAADRGVVDSQYNLGLLYEAGDGVAKNLREAYRWFAIGANAGDVASREKQVEIEARLAPAERAGLERDAAFRPGAAQSTEADTVLPPATTLTETQAFLARRGYYVGPVDGQPSPGLKAAAAAYLRDNPGAAGGS
jgi:localization factor PodJL